MSLDFSDILAAIAVVINGIPQGLLALGFGFASRPTGLGFLVSAVAGLHFRSIAPVSFQAETITIAGINGRDKRERISIIVLSGVILLIISLVGWFTKIAEYAGPTINSAMMAGVGIILALVALNFFRMNKIIGGISILVAIVTYLYFDNIGSSLKVVYTITVSVALATVVANTPWVNFAPIAYDSHEDRFIWQLPRLLLNKQVVKGILAVIMMGIGGNIAFGKITEGIANYTHTQQVVVNIDHLTIYSSLFKIVSGLFGGGTGDAIISGTAGATHPVMAAFVFSISMAAILLTGQLPRIGRRVPQESISGFLLVLGVVLTFFPNSNLMLGGIPTTNIIAWVLEGGFLPYVGGSDWLMDIVAIATFLATWRSSNPFIGMMTGLLARSVLFFAPTFSGVGELVVIGSLLGFSMWYFTDFPLILARLQKKVFRHRPK